MADPRAQWMEVVEVLHALLTCIVARGQYPEGHPAIERVDEALAALLAKAHQRLVELVVAVVEGELFVQGRPVPELRARMPVLLDAFARHGIECLVLLQGIDKRELTALATSLAGPADTQNPALAREKIQTDLRRVLVRFVSLGEIGRAPEEEEGEHLQIEPLVADLMQGVAEKVRARAAIDVAAVRAVATRILEVVSTRTFALRPRRFDEGPKDLPAHCANVAIMSAAVALEGQLPPAAIVEIAAAALLHDVGELLLPEALQGVPDPLLDERGARYARHHPLLGARALLEAGCPALWVATALDHHRGVDGLGYPAPALDAPHEATRIVSIANFLERKRVPLGDAPEPHDAGVRAALGLAGRYFDAAWLGVALRALGVFPPGTVVELTDGQPAMVARVNPTDPLRPEVRLLFGDDAGTRVDLLRFEPLERRYANSIVRALVPKPGVREDDRLPRPVED
jgi:HD-GYP domain-containing protein (c-di-GMP phosphodiesterase class II)